MCILRRSCFIGLHSAAPRLSLLVAPRRLSTTVTHQRSSRKGRVLLFTSALSGAVLFGIWGDAKSCPDPPFTFPGSQDVANTSIRHTPDLIPLLRSYFVYSLLSIPAVVDHAPALLEQLLQMPVVGNIVEIVVRHTFFAQFVAGDTIQHTLLLFHQLRAENKAVLLAYSAEVDESEAAGLKSGAHSSIGAPDSQPVHKRIMEETIRSIDAAGDFEDSIAQGSNPLGRRTSVAVKLTALLPRADALRNLSVYLIRMRTSSTDPVPFPGTPSSADLPCLQGSTSSRGIFPLTDEDIRDLRELLDDLKKICTRASERGVRVIIDAEHSWYQPAIDTYGHILMEEFNKLPAKPGLASRRKTTASSSTRRIAPQPLVYVTYQAYLRRTPTYLAHSLAHSRRQGYALGVKLVRGAYHPHELAAHTGSLPHRISISSDSAPPVHLSKSDTDACYHACVAFLVRVMAEDVAFSPDPLTNPPRLGVLFGTHNWLSSRLILEELVKNGLAYDAGAGENGVIVIPPEVAERFALAQHFGMTDSLTNYLVESMRCTMPCVVKYVPRGSLAEVLPYLSRRAIENKSVLGKGAATRERKEAAKLIWEQLFGSFGL